MVRILPVVSNVFETAVLAEETTILLTDRNLNASIIRSQWTGGSTFACIARGLRIEHTLQKVSLFFFSRKSR